MSAEREPLVGLTGDVGDHYIPIEPVISIGGISFLERSIVSDAFPPHKGSRRGRRRFLLKLY